MRIGDWKVLADEALQEFEMYHLGSDPHETQNLVEHEADKFREMRAALERLNAQIEAEGPDWWQNYRRPGQRRNVERRSNSKRYFPRSSMLR